MRTRGGNPRVTPLIAFNRDALLRAMKNPRGGVATLVLAATAAWLTLVTTQSRNVSLLVPFSGVTVCVCVRLND